MPQSIAYRLPLISLIPEMTVKYDEKVYRITHSHRQEEGGQDLGNDGQLGTGQGKQTDGAEQRENNRQQGEDHPGDPTKQ